MIFFNIHGSSTKHMLIFKFNMGIAGLYANKKFRVDFCVFLPWISVSSAYLLSLTSTFSGSLPIYCQWFFQISFLSLEPYSEQMTLFPTPLRKSKPSACNFSLLHMMQPSFLHFHLCGKGRPFSPRLISSSVTRVPSFPYSTHLVLYLQTLLVDKNIQISFAFK